MLKTPAIRGDFATACPAETNVHLLVGEGVKRADVNSCETFTERAVQIFTSIKQSTDRFIPHAN